jgi:hypothetical protein
MNPRSLCAIVLALALPAFGQTEPPLEPLVPPRPPPAKTKKKSKKPPADAQGQLSLPPLAPLTEPRPLKSVGVLVQGLPDDAAERVREGLRNAASLAPGAKEAIALEAPQPCADEACWVTAGIARNVDHVVTASYAAGTLRLRMIDVATRKLVQEAQQAGVSADPVEVTAWAEALGCRVMVPAGCTRPVMVEADFGISLELDGEPLRPSEKRMVPVGMHSLRVKEGTSESLREIPVLLEGTPPISIASSRRAPPAAPASAPAAAVATSTELPGPAKRTWTRTAGYATAGAAVLAVAAGAYFGLKSKSEIDSAESAYRANGGAWQPADLETLRSGNSKAHTANALFIASGVLLAASAALTFVF